MLERWLKPRTEHPDPDVRIKAFAEVSPNDPALTSAAAGDADAAVRASIVQRLDDAKLLADRASADSDENVRAVAAARLGDVLCADALNADEDDRVAVLAAQSDEALLCRVVREAQAPYLRDAAFDALVAKGAADTGLLETIGSGDPDSDLRARAVDLIDDVDALDRVAVQVRKSDKDLHRRAREKIRAIRDDEQREHSRRQLTEDILALAERPLEAQSDALHRRQARLQHWREGWTRTGAEDDAGVAEAVAAIEARIAEARAVVIERRRILEELAVAEVEAVGADAWRKRWDALADHRDSDRRRFDQALADLKKRAAEAKRLSQSRTRAATLLGEWEGTDWSRTPVDDKRLAQLESHWQKIGLDAASDEDLTQRYHALLDKLRNLRGTQADAAERAGEEALKLVTQLAEDLKAGRSAEATSARDKLNHRLSQTVPLPGGVEEKVRKQLAALEPELQKLREWRHWGADQAREQLCKEVEELATTAESMKPSRLAKRVKDLRTRWQGIDKGVGAAAPELWSRFDKACEVAYAPAKAAFDKQAEERRENAVKKRALCEQLEVYTRDADWSAPDWGAAVKLLNDTRRSWREIGGVSHKQFAKLRERYRKAIAGLDAKLDDERQREVRRRELAIAALQKTTEQESLSEQIEAAKTLQKNWNPTVRAGRRKEQALWENLREVCDGIFAKRKEQSAQRREQESDARGEREALIDQIEQLLTSDDVDAAAVNQASGRFDAIRRDWRAAGRVSPKLRKTLDGRYRKASKAFEQRRDRLQRRERDKSTLALLERVLLAEKLRQQGDAGGDAAQQALDELPPIRAPLVKRLDAALSKPADASQEDERLTAKRELCLRMEMKADIDSPPEFQNDRMALKIAMLSESMGGGGDSAHGWEDSLFAWVESAPVAANDWPALRERFERATRACLTGK